MYSFTFMASHAAFLCRPLVVLLRPLERFFFAAAAATATAATTIVIYSALCMSPRGPTLLLLKPTLRLSVPNRLATESPTGQRP